MCHGKTGEYQAFNNGKRMTFLFLRTLLRDITPDVTSDAACSDGAEKNHKVLT